MVHDYIFAYSPHTDRVHLDADEDHHPAHVKTHADLAQDAGEPDLVHGHAYRIRGGWRILDYDHQPLSDPHIRKRVAETASARDHSE